MTDRLLTPEEHLAISRRVYSETIRHLADTNDALGASLTATQERCNQLLVENRDLKKRVASMEKRWVELLHVEELRSD
jgi:hypothetical protein